MFPLKHTINPKHLEHNLTETLPNFYYYLH